CTASICSASLRPSETGKCTRWTSASPSAVSSLGRDGVTSRPSSGAHCRELLLFFPLVAARDVADNVEVEPNVALEFALEDALLVAVCPEALGTILDVRARTNAVALHPLRAEIR